MFFRKLRKAKAQLKLQEYARLYFLKEMERQFLQDNHYEEEIQYRMLLKENEFIENAKGDIFRHETVRWFFTEPIDGEIDSLYKRVEENPFDVLFKIYKYFVKYERDDPRFNRCSVRFCIFRHCERFSYGTPLDYFRLALKWFRNDGQVCEVALRAELNGYGDLCDLLKGEI
jgi:hypothetical protein